MRRSPPELAAVDAAFHIASSPELNGGTTPSQRVGLGRLEREPRLFDTASFCVIWPAVREILPRMATIEPHTVRPAISAVEPFPALIAMLGILGAVALVPTLMGASLKPLAPRQVISLDGTWQVAEGGFDRAPRSFGHQVPVPGLLDMAEPALADVGKSNNVQRAFWYRRVFKVDGPVPAVAQLKVHKAKYGMKVFLNGQLVGDHLPCFTPAYFNVKSPLRGEGQENELIIRLGAHRDNLPADMPTGWDFEKYLYLPGIYDSVEVILAGEAYIGNVQTVPDVPHQRVRVLVELAAITGTAEGKLDVTVEEAASGRPVAAGSVVTTPLAAGETRTLELTLPIEHCRLWSPEDPFLYTVKVRTAGDAARVRFGMRSFAFDPTTGRALLNGRTYFLRGSNVTLYRFFEDAERKDRPWRAEWVRRLHRQFKTMHWNSLRYCIGFPPEFWYDLADEEGFLIQDEFPIWLLGKAPENPTAEKIIPEYTAWLQERWNHPCVVIWDAQNESHTEETGKALQAVRPLDRSNRPWENGWAAPQSLMDCVEAHPYLFIRDWQKQAPFRLRELAQLSGVPRLQNEQQKLAVPVVINEYAWLWLTRDGQPTCLTDRVYENLLGPKATVAQRRLAYARNLAALTEFWRAHRECAGVLHFCGLGYSRPGDQPRPEGGATSDHFTDLEQLTFEPLFAEYVREAFNPVGLMLDFWEETVPANTDRAFRVYAINDRDEPWQGTIELRVLQDGRPVSTQSRTARVAALGREILTLVHTTPKASGAYTIEARLRDATGRPVRSQRDVRVTP